MEVEGMEALILEVGGLALVIIVSIFNYKELRAIHRLVNNRLSEALARIDVLEKLLKDRA